MSEIESFIDEFEHPEELTVARFDKCLTIAQKSAKQIASEKLENSMQRPEKVKAPIILMPQKKKRKASELLEMIKLEEANLNIKIVDNSYIIEEQFMLSAEEQLQNQSIVVQEQIMFETQEEICLSNMKAAEKEEKFMNVNCKREVFTPKTFKKMKIESENKSKDSNNLQLMLQDEVKRSKIQIETEDGIKDAWKCERCDQVLKHPQYLRGHIKNLHLSKIKKDVNKEAERKKFLEDVKNSKIIIESEDGIKEAYKCFHCEQILKNQENLRKHIKFIHMKIDKIDESDWMNIINEVDNCKVWMETEDGTQETRYKCSKCDMILKSAETMKYHLKRTHFLKNPESKPTIVQQKWLQNEAQNSRVLVELEDGSEEIRFKCPKCDILLKSTATFYNHFKNSHVNLNLEEADERERIRWLQNETRQSEVTIDTPDGPKTCYQCPRCEIILKSTDTFKQHMKNTHLRVEGYGEQIDENLKQWYSEMMNNSRIIIVTDNGEETQYNCCICKNSHFNTWVRMRKHLTEIHLEPSNDELNDKIQLKYPCYECPIRFENAKFLEHHRDLHETFRIVSLLMNYGKCESCRYIFANDDDYNTHLVRHLTNEDILEPIPVIGAVAKCGKPMKKRIQKEPLIIESENTWKCGHCLTIFADQYDCNKHLMLHHAASFVCPLDKREFTGFRASGIFNLHMKTKHPNLFPDLVVSCSFCLTTFDNVYDKIAHARNCSAKPYLCDHCGKFYRISFHVILNSNQILFNYR